MCAKNNQDRREQHVLSEEAHSLCHAASVGTVVFSELELCLGF